MPLFNGPAIGIPLILLLGSVFASKQAPLARAARITALALALAVVSAALPVAALAMPRSSTPWAVGSLDIVTSVMLLLVCAIGAVIARYSKAYLGGDPGRARYARWLLATLAAVTSLILANHLIVFAAAWTATSLALHQLLTFYSDRPAALVAAHKKFLVSRLADVALLGAIGLIYGTVGSGRFDVVGEWVAAQSSLPVSLHVAAVLLVAAASLKSAQLPFHGWLTQVMDAPTPVSALLHAGVVNIGGFLMIRMSGLMAHAPGAQTLLVIIGTTTCVLAALIMSTRVSVKVALAWSTCAQMGFMLVQCGLGAWSLALLHLVAHSVYKAHAFLSSGSAVEAWRAQTFLPARSRPSLARGFASAGVVLTALGLAALAIAWAGGGPLNGDLSRAPLSLVIGLALVPLVWRLPDGGVRRGIACLLRVAGVGLLYVVWHSAATALRLDPVMPAAGALAPSIVAAAFAALFVIQTILESHPHGRLARALHHWLFAGLHLDERFTRATFRLWPPRLQRRPESGRPMPVTPAWEPQR